MEPKLPARIDRATFDRLLQRAAELQAASSDIGDGVSEDELLALGKEVGIPEQHLRQALLEERTRAVPAEPTDTLDAWFGRADLTSERVVQGTEEGIALAIARYLESREHFVLQRAAVGRTTFEPMSPFAGAMRKMRKIFDGSGKPYLERAELISVVITPLEAGFCHVTIAATLRRTRRAYVGGATALGVGGLIGGVLMVVLGAPELAAIIPIVPGAAAGVAVSRQFRPVAARAQLGLERLLDELERKPSLPPGAAPQGPNSSRLAREVGQVVRDITTEVRKALEDK
ncbi:MAG: hypothetical protein ABIZ70_04335 [Gemmatimonadales bacterium]